MFEWTKNQHDSFTIITKESSEKDQHKMQTHFFYMFPTPLNGGIFTFTLRTHVYNLKKNRISKFNIKQTKAKNSFFYHSYKKYP